MNSTFFASKQRTARIVAAGIRSTIALLGMVAAFGGVARAQLATYSSNVGGDIPDGNGTGISSTINVVDDFTISEFTSVRIDGLQHTWLGDLVITLTHSGKTVDIIDRVRGERETSAGDNSDFSGNYTFVTTGGVNFNSAVGLIGDNDIISPGVSYATVPVGNLNPSGGISNANGLLSDFAGMNAFGAWTLNISDRLGVDAGSFTGWQFMIAAPSFITQNTTISDASYNGFSLISVQSNALTLADGAEVQNVKATNNSRVFMNGGTADSLRAEDSARLFVNDGTIAGAIEVTENGRLTMGGGSASTVSVLGNGIANITDGAIDLVSASGNGKAYLFDGTFTDLATAGNGEIFVYGGSISRNTIYAYDNGSYSFFGEGLSLDFLSAVRGDDGNGFLGTFYNLTGTLTDGTALDTRFFDADGGYSLSSDPSTSALFFNGSAVGPAVVPEASTFALALPALGMTGALVIGRRRKN